MCPAIHTDYRSKLRSSSTRESSDPLRRVVIVILFESVGIGTENSGARCTLRCSSPPSPSPRRTSDPLRLQRSGKQPPERARGSDPQRHPRRRRRPGHVTQANETPSSEARTPYGRAPAEEETTVQSPERHAPLSRHPESRTRSAPDAPMPPHGVSDTSHARTRTRRPHAAKTPDLISAGPEHHRRTRLTRPKAPTPLIRSIQKNASYYFIIRASSLLVSSNRPGYSFELSHQSLWGRRHRLLRPLPRVGHGAPGKEDAREAESTTRTDRTSQASDDPLPPHEITNASPIRSPHLGFFFPKNSFLASPNAKPAPVPWRSAAACLLYERRNLRSPSHPFQSLSFLNHHSVVSSGAEQPTSRASSVQNRAFPSTPSTGVWEKLDGADPKPRRVTSIFFKQ
ncbi:hypothetical protein NPIL_368891 [Nephila pilipes]|uniref:Uncharacterized protein n=1 Tax=Nephila pilipes TaxID=299642 RepID=A0A8X6NTU1_NEPPI|nr:hypothetical protein NPIL_368891 [Nephila pilipes]